MNNFEICRSETKMTDPSASVTKLLIHLYSIIRIKNL